ncbi:oxalurate catabolism protein HpxZ [Xenophilus arseniciresistens]|uniref:Oxalurate catabolism protein HpxZ n=1 Tax=Xenophilus arseniciresistens TaxID=1283306 RepID=A0AAE3NAC2_9BURK|nr:oxalurate catabolism protein HpxZ [Xenophilus arseniciresistens]MDA7419025.1 oxalurate catabolism protein HpxZ [Xenophilus arseniciresistens]
MTQEINLPDVLAELTEVFAQYEEALVNNKVEVLDALFWNSPHTLRYGVAEVQYGHAAIQAYRAAQPAQGQPRTLTRTVITTYGREYGTANVEFQREGESRIGRQSQTWLRLPEGWRVVAAHVSLMG